MNRLRHALLLLLICLCPLQGWAALAMPQCRHAQRGQTQAMAGETMPCHADKAHAPRHDGDDCADCGHCHGSPMLGASFVPRFQHLAAQSAAPAYTGRAQVDAWPELPFRPPRS